jgi:hypothetical protein
MTLDFESPSPSIGSESVPSSTEMQAQSSPIEAPVEAVKPARRRGKTPSQMAEEIGPAGSSVPPEPAQETMADRVRRAQGQTYTAKELASMFGVAESSVINALTPASRRKTGQPEGFGVIGGASASGKKAFSPVLISRVAPGKYSVVRKLGDE